MTTERVTTLLDAEDRASAKFAAAGGALQRAFGPAALKSALVSLVSFSALAAGVGISLTVVTQRVAKYIQETQAANRALTMMNTRLTLTGMGAAQAARRMDELRNSLSRAQQASLAKLDPGIQDLLASFSTEEKEKIADMAKALERLGVDAEQALEWATLAGGGNFTDIEKWLKVPEGTITSWEHLDEEIQKLLDARTPLEKIGSNIEDALDKAIKDTIAGINAALDGDLGTALQKFGDLLGKTFGMGDIATRIKEDMDKMVLAIQEFDVSALTAKGTEIAGALFVGFMNWWLGSTAVTLMVAILTLQWHKVWPIIGPKIIQWGKDIGTWLLDGWKKIQESDFGRWVNEHIVDPIEKFVTEFLPRMKELGIKLGVEFGNGIIDNINKAIAEVVRVVNSWITAAVERFNSILPSKLHIRAPQLGGVTIGRLGESAVGPIPGSSRGGGTRSQPLVIEVNGRTLAHVMADVVDGWVQLRNPGGVVS